MGYAILIMDNAGQSLREVEPGNMAHVHRDLADERWQVSGDCVACNGTGRVPVVTRKKPDPASRWPQNAIEEMGQTVREIGLGLPLHDGNPPDSWDAEQWERNEELCRSMESQRRQSDQLKNNSCWVLCDPCEPDSNWTTHDSLMRPATVNRLLALQSYSSLLLSGR